MASEIKIGGKRKRISTLLNEFYKEYGREPKSDKELQNYVVQLEKNPYQFHQTADRRQTLAEQRFTHSLAKEQREDERKRLRLENDLRRQKAAERHYRTQEGIQRESMKLRYAEAGLTPPRGVQEIVFAEPFREWKTKQAEKVRDYLWRQNKREPTHAELKLELERRSLDLESMKLTEREVEFSRKYSSKYSGTPLGKSIKPTYAVIGHKPVYDYPKEGDEPRLGSSLSRYTPRPPPKKVKQIPVSVDRGIKRDREEFIRPNIRLGRTIPIGASNPYQARQQGHTIGHKLEGIRVGGKDRQGSIIAREQSTTTTRPVTKAGEIIVSKSKEKPPEKLEPIKNEPPKEAPKLSNINAEKGAGTSLTSRIRAKLGI